MKRILRNTAAACAVFAAAMLCLPSCESTPSGKATTSEKEETDSDKENDDSGGGTNTGNEGTDGDGTGTSEPTETLDTSELTEIVTFDSVNFANVKSGDTITVTTVAGKGLFQTSAPSSAVLSLSTKGTSGTVLSGGTWSANATALKRGASLKSGTQTTVYTLSEENAALVKKSGLSVWAGGATITAVKNSSASATVSSSVNKTDSAKKYFSDNLSAGWNLGNDLDTSNITSNSSSYSPWCGVKSTKQMFANVKSAGFDFIRIPITWKDHYNTSTGKINEQWMAYAKEVVQNAVDAGFVAVINLHHDGADNNSWLNVSKADDSRDEYLEVTSQFTDFWSQISYAFRDFGSNLMFESLNEIHDGGWGWGINLKDDGLNYAILNRWSQAFCTVVRSGWGNNSYRYLAFNGYCSNPDLTVDAFEFPKDSSASDGINRFALSFHYYQPVSFGINAEIKKWGSDYGNVPKGECDDWGQEKTMDETFAKVAKKFTDCAIYVGEYGATYNGTKYSDYQRYYDEYLVKSARKNGMLCVAWDNNAGCTGKESFGLIDRSTGNVRSNYSAIVEAIMRASKASSDYEITDPSEK